MWSTIPHTHKLLTVVRTLQMSLLSKVEEKCPLPFTCFRHKTEHQLCFPYQPPLIDSIGNKTCIREIPGSKLGYPHIYSFPQTLSGDYRNIKLSYVSRFIWHQVTSAAHTASFNTKPTYPSVTTRLVK